ncbi:unnamed protein product, partial [Effrenium voratum]
MIGALAPAVPSTPALAGRAEGGSFPALRARRADSACWRLAVLGVVARAAKAKSGKAAQPGLEKEISRLGVASRRHLTRLIRGGRVTVEGQVVRNPKEEVALEAELAIDAIPLHRDPPALLKFHKPYDVISSMDEKNRTDLSDALPGQHAPWDQEAVEEARVALGGRVKPQEVKEMLAEQGMRPWVALGQYHPVGRLDRDTTGLLLFSRDGVLTAKLLSPSSEVPRCYDAVVEGDVTKVKSEGGLAERLRRGVVTSEGVFPATLLSAELLSPEEAGRAGHADNPKAKANSLARSRVTLEVTEGKYRMVRKMLYNCGHEVLELHRRSYGPIGLGELEVGRMTSASPEEVDWAEQLVASRRKGGKSVAEI